MNKKNVLKIVVEDRYGTIVDEYNFEEGEFLVGRSKQCDIVLPSDNVSRRHAKIFTYENMCFIEDLHSSNGVFVNGKRIREPTELKNESVIRIGDYHLHFYSPYAEKEEDRVFCRLIGQNLISEGQTFVINQTVCLIGRGKDCGITLPDPSISRLHAKIFIDQDGLIRVEDLNSSNGTFINNIQIKEGNLKEGDKVRFGNLEFLVEIPTADTVETGFEKQLKRNIFLFPFYFIIEHIKIFTLLLLIIVLTLLLSLYLPHLMKKTSSPLKMNDLVSTSYIESRTHQINEEIEIKMLLLESLLSIIDKDYAISEGKLKEVLWKNPTNTAAQKLYNILQLDIEGKKKMESAQKALQKGNYELTFSQISSVSKNILNKFDLANAWLDFYKEIFNKLNTNCKILWSKKCIEILKILERMKQ